MRIVVADDHAVYRAGLSLMLKQLPAAPAVREAASLQDALLLLAAEENTLGIFDLDMPGMDGPQSLADIKKRYPRLRIVVLSASADQTTIDACNAIGCCAYISKASSLSETLRTVGNVLAAATSVQSTGPTPRQLEVLRLVSIGLSNKEIARQIGIAPGTVKLHLAALFMQFNVRNRTELISRCNEAFTPSFQRAM